MQLNPYNNDIAQDMDTAEENINNIKYGYTGDDIAEHEEKIQKLFPNNLRMFSILTVKLYQDIVNNIEGKGSYRYFDVEGDEDSIELPQTFLCPSKSKVSQMVENVAFYNRALDK